MIGKESKITIIPQNVVNGEWNLAIDTVLEPLHKGCVEYAKARMNNPQLRPSLSSPCPSDRVLKGE